MAGDRKRKGSSKAKKNKIYKDEGRYEANKLHKSKKERKKYIRAVAKHGVVFDMGDFTRCKKCERITMTPTYCVSCGFRAEVKSNNKKEN